MKMRKTFLGIIAYGIVGALGLTASTALAVKPSPPCHPNGVVREGEDCDPGGPVFRGGATCETLGFDGGTLVCTSMCQVDESGCFSTPSAVFPGDGAGSGPALSYTDNRDGTATDNNTLLMWEVKDNAGGIHDVGNMYAWSSSGSAADGALFTVFLATLNTPPCFVGHCDWRIPNVRELQSIADYGRFIPAIDPTFPGLTAAWLYWAATSYAGNPPAAWTVYFYDGSVDANGKSLTLHGRAVRSGS